MAELKKTFCNRDCPDACGIVATVEDGRVVRLAGDPDHPVTQGFLCHRTSQFLHTQYSPERLTSPMLREGDRFVPISWEAAIDLCVERLTRVRRESGPAAIFHYHSGGTLGLLNYVIDHFFERFGPVTVKRGDICSGAGDAAQLLDFGEEDSSDLFGLRRSRSILVWGKNIFTSSPHTIPVIKEAKANGARVLLVDPVHTKTTSIADLYLQPRPGSDFALAMAVARLVFERGWADPEAARYCDHLGAFRAMAESKTVDAWCAEADVTAADALQLAQALGRDKPCAILVGWGMARRVNGAAIVRALDALGAVTGNVGIEGGGVSYYFKRRGAFDTSFAQKQKPPRTVCEPLFGQDLRAPHAPPIRLVWITAGNTVAMRPASEGNAAALRATEFVVVVDSFLTDTARCASLVLPTTTLLEADDLLGAYGHHYLSAPTPVVPPPPGVKSDLEIVQALAERVGLGKEFRGSPRAWKERFTATTLKPRGVTVEQLEQGPVLNPLPARVLFADRKFPTPTGRVNLIAEAPRVDADPADASYPLMLLSSSTERSQSSQWAKDLEGPLVLTVHPDAAPGLADGSLGRLVSSQGSLPVKVKLDPRQRRDVALVPKGGHLHRGQAANALIRPRLTDLGEGASLYDERVRLVADAPAPAPAT